MFVSNLNDLETLPVSLVVMPSSRLTGISAFCLGVAVFYAPLAYGCTRPEMLPTLYLLLGLGIGAGLLGMFSHGRLPKVPKTVLVCFAAVMFQGWWMMADPVLPPMVPDNGGLIDTSLDNLGELSLEAMLMVTLMLGAFLFLCVGLVAAIYKICVMVFY